MISILEMPFFLKSQITIGNVYIIFCSSDIGMHGAVVPFFVE